MFECDAMALLKTNTTRECINRLIVVSVTLLKTAVDCFHKNQLLMALKLNLDSCWGIAEITGPYLCKNMFKTELSSFYILVHTVH
jgi:hypothetical protein